MKPAKFYIVDPNLQKITGHHYHYDIAIQRAVQKEQFETWLLCHREAKLASTDVNLKPVFRSRYLWKANPFWLRVPYLGRSLEHLLVSLAFFLELLLNLGLGMQREDLVFFPDVAPKMLYAIMGWYKLIPPQKRPKLRLMFMISSRHYEMPSSYRALQALARLKTKDIGLYTHSERLSREYTRFSRLPVAVLPLPNTFEQLEAYSKESLPVSIPPQAMCFIALGDARDEKGLVELAQAILYLQRENKLDGLHFVIQKTRVQSDYPEVCHGYLRHLQQAGISQISWIDEALSSEDYFGLLTRADVVLLPYRLNHYVSRSSGILVEAIAAGKPVVTTAGTWLAQELEQFGSGLLCQSENPVSLAQAILAMSKDLPSYRAQADALKLAYRSRHHADEFLKQILQAPKPTPYPSKIAVIYPINGVVTQHSGSSRRVAQMIGYLARNFDHVRVLSPDGNYADFWDANVFYTFFNRSNIEHFLYHHIAHRLYDLYWWLITLGEIRFEENHYWPMWEFYHLPQDRRFHSYVQRLVRWADVLVLEYPFLAEPVLKYLRKEQIPLILTCHDIHSQMVASNEILRQAVLEKEKRAYAAADKLVTVSQQDSDMLASWGIPSLTVEHGIDLQSYERWSISAEDARRILKENYEIKLPDAPFCLFVGSYNIPNSRALDYLHEIAESLAHLSYLQEEAHIVVVGSCSPKLEKKHFWALGELDDSVLRLVYQAADLVLIPLSLGTGASVKTAEAMVYGKAILGTNIAFRGYTISPGVEAIIHDEISQYPQLILSLLKDRPKLEALGCAARNFAARFDSQLIYQAYRDLILEGCEVPEQKPPMAEIMQANILHKQQIPDVLRKRWFIEERQQMLADGLRERSEAQKRETE